ncbi:ribonuclease HII [Candidatus Galacturonibacter soehngenii]|uniref:Ribonuclease HII n=1 Tax=Candidatus Galacturonatibacter soehngenii TaxID=2307010 RepID=A0A7V7UD35_9FIRM|nr:ribonuclease HII [Candidatus Galacturonibacter soehngenii]KAB1440012.1 ribonuclease HII [Candidatus Galacturonibacter soehngenii]
MEMKINQIKEELQAADMNMLPVIIRKYESDTRNGVVTLIKKYQGRIQKLEAEKLRIELMKQYEKKYEDYSHICGIDEVGRGPLAGPVVASAVILPKECDILYINDSKKLSEKKREELYDEIMEKAVAVGIGIVGPQVIDEINILQATYEAMRIAIKKLSVSPDILLNDAVTIPDITIPQVPIIKGDAKSISIAAASIVAKVTRDRLMIEYDKLIPEYSFAENKGYGTSVHIGALKKYGASPIHRQSFIKNLI